MATFLSRFKFAEQGLKNVSQTTHRGAAIEAMAKKMRARLTSN